MAKSGEEGDNSNVEPTEVETSDAEETESPGNANEGAEQGDAAANEEAAGVARAGLVGAEGGAAAQPEDEETGTLSMKDLYNAEPLHSNLYANAEVNVDPKVVQMLTDGFVQRFVPSLENARKTIEQIRSSQTVLVETVQQETSKFTDCKAKGDLEVTMDQAKLYHNKLVRLRREMTALHEKSARLKKRALRLQQQRQKEELTRAHDQEKEFEKERMLTAKVAAPSAPTSPSS
ncbi:biogenesis of lysosome-related organelles complex 1 subunit 6 [Aplysia californica]|uniref:Biogenesis of lysosome-related organelles complex 1 subunit 6 n=1 Tax=Aplysia californica TaxID=6500 RepID=A0ABM1ACF3_APLCA|nr:biogenesis of lysosome-related organelles complex 1 subunit 6 [Aplysia californica]